ncbi:MAG: ComEC/Rec2 family competence protein [Defluviimonas denitrificans]
MLLLSSLAAGLATAPIAAAHFNRIAEYGLIANLLAVPLMGMVVMPAGVIAAVLAPLGLAQPALWVMGQGTAFILWVAGIVSGLEGAVQAVPTPPVRCCLCWRLAGSRR